jgi:NADPH2:quinone reductase
MVAGRYQVRLDPPFIPGTEFAGEVVSAPDTGPPVDAPVTGVVPSGAFAEFVAADPDDLRPLPAGLDFTTGAAFQVTYRTAYHALVTIGGAAGGVGLATGTWPVDSGSA